MSDLSLERSCVVEWDERVEVNQMLFLFTLTRSPVRGESLTRISAVKILPASRRAKPITLAVLSYRLNRQILAIRTKFHARASRIAQRADVTISLTFTVLNGTTRVVKKRCQPEWAGRSHRF